MLDESWTIAAYREYLKTYRLADAETATLDVDYLLAHCCQQSRAWLLSHLDMPLTLNAHTRLKACYDAFVGGEPLAYVLGSQPFMSIDFAVTHDTLIPRADTGALVEWILGRWDDATPLRVADCGTGSGTIAVMLAHERPQWVITATDISEAALNVCAANARRAGVNIQCVHGSWFEPLEGKFDLIVSNPPYLAKDDSHLPALTHEPLCALVSEDNGLADLKHLVTHAPSYLSADGVLVLEHGATQGQAVRWLFAENEWSNVETFPDIAGRDRFTVGIRRRNE